MKAELDDRKDFKPIPLHIVIETEEELLKFYAVFNSMPIQRASGLGYNTFGTIASLLYDKIRTDMQGDASREHARFTAELKEQFTGKGE